MKNIKNNKKIALLSIIVLNFFCGPVLSETETNIVFQENFDNVDQWEKLLPDINPRRWTSLERTRSPNYMQISKERFHSGTQSLKLFAEGTRGGELSKSSLVRDVFNLNLRDHVTISAWFYIPSGKSLKNITLMDLECWHCWSKFNIFNNQSPGLRLQIYDDEGTLSVDRGKIGFRGDSFEQDSRKARPLPRDRWTKIDWVLELGIEDAGYTEVFVDDISIISKRGTNVPDPSVFLKYAVILNTPTKYDAIEIGISANPEKNDIELYIDDISVSVSTNSFINK